jgi:predicted DNA binding CopG/RHH family protein
MKKKVNNLTIAQEETSITVKVNRVLWKQVKMKALERDLTMRVLVEEALRRAVGPA